MTKKFILPVFLSLLINLSISILPAKAAAASGRVLITEIKLGGGTDPKEFVEIYNDTGSVVDLSHFTLEYAKPGFAVTGCSTNNWKTLASPSSQVNSLVLGGVLPVAGITSVPLAMNDAVAGALRVTSQYSSVFSVHDTVRWGDDGPCFTTQQNAIPANGSSLNRVFDPTGRPIFSVSGSDFVVLPAPSPGIIPCVPGGCQVTTQPAAYPVVNITELLPDPAVPKTDSDDEYIELYNPSDFTVRLDGYNLFTASSASLGVQSRGLNNFVLLPHEYKALYSRDTGLGLVNAASGQAWLTAPDDIRIAETPWYPANMGPDTAWAIINGTWQATTSLSPGAENPLPPPDSVVPDAQPAAEKPTDACPAGKYRNPETNRCKTIETDEPALTACKPGQERNPETNRCRAVTTSTTTLTPCDAGQERNPDTNRCRKIATSTELAPCQTGYERNPETNRCRKITAVKAATTSTPSSDSHSHATINSVLMMGVSSMVIIYAAYEYRADMSTFYQRCKKRLKRAV